MGKGNVMVNRVEANRVTFAGNARHPELGLYITLMNEKEDIEMSKHFTEDEAREIAYDILNWLGEGVVMMP